MDWEGILIFMYIITPFIGAVLLVSGLIAFLSWKKRGITKTVWICLCLMLVLIVGWTILLLQSRDYNATYTQHDEDYVETGNILYWDDDSFSYDGEEYVRIQRQIDHSSWYWNCIDELGAWDFDERWKQDHAVFNLRNRLSFIEWLAAYDIRATVFSLESETGETILMSTAEGYHEYHCQKKAINKVIKYYSDLNNYDFYVNGRIVEAPSQKTIDALNQIVSHKGDKVSQSGKNYTLRIKSRDKLYEGSLNVKLVGKTYYVVVWDSDYSGEIVDSFYKIPEHAADELQKYLEENPHADKNEYS